MIWTGCCSAAAIRSFLERNWKKTKLYGWKFGKNCSRDCLFWQSAEALCICTIFEDMEGNFCKGIGHITGKSYRTPRLSRFGYIQVNSKNGKLFGTDTGSCPAHEFHYFDSTNCGTDCYAAKPESSRGWDCLHVTDTMLAGFPHFYYYGNPRLPMAFTDCCRAYRKHKKEGL